MQNTVLELISTLYFFLSVKKIGKLLAFPILCQLSQEHAS